MTRAYRPSRGSGLRDLLHIYLTTWREGAVMIAVVVGFIEIGSYFA